MIRVLKGDRVVLEPLSRLKPWDLDLIEPGMEESFNGVPVTVDEISSQLLMFTIKGQYGEFAYNFNWIEEVL